MTKCTVCGEAVPPSDFRGELLRRADALGLFSLTENEQLLALGEVCEDCYDKL